MEMHLDMALQHLHCVTPTDPSGEDEPYLWVFFIVADGNTIRQNMEDPLRLSASIAVRSGSGRPGNLNGAQTTSGGGIHIPESVGRHQSAIKPIVLNLPVGAAPIKVFIPGRMIAVCAALDEEAVPRDAMEAAFNAVKAHIQNRLNDFFNSLTLVDFMGALDDPADPLGAASAVFNQRLDAVVSQISDEAPDIAEDVAIAWVKDNVDWWDPVSWANAIAAFADREESIGSHTFTTEEATLIDHSLHEDLRGDLRQPHENLGGAWYVVSGYSNATVRFVPGDHKLTQLPPQTQIAGLPQRHTLQVQRKCVDPAETVTTQLRAHVQAWQLVVDYPFLDYEYALDGQALAGDAGTVQLGKVASFPVFDESKFYFQGATTESRTVNLSYQFLAVAGAPQLRRLVIRNDPADGNYSAMLTVVGLLANGTTIPVMSGGLNFVGQSIKFADGFLDRYIACVARELKEKWPQVKKVAPNRWRTPEVAWNQYAEIVNQLDELQSLQIVDARKMEKLKQGIAARLKLELPG